MIRGVLDANEIPSLLIRAAQYPVLGFFIQVPRGLVGKAEQVVDLKNLALTGLGGGAVSVAPDGSPLLLLDRGTQDVYALDWTEP